MRRTQIYLSESEAEVLARESKRTGRTRSQLIREAIGARYLDAHSSSALEKALLETAGAWQGSGRKNVPGQVYVEKLRRGSRLSAAIARRLPR